MRFSSIVILILLYGCNSTDSSPRSDGTVNGFILTGERGFSGYGEDRIDWVKTSIYSSSYASLRTCDYEMNDVCGSTNTYEFDANGRVKSRTFSSFAFGPSTVNYEIREDLVVARKGTPADFVYRHDENGIVKSMNFDDNSAETIFTNNAAGQITNATFIDLDDGREVHYAHFYDEQGQRVRTEGNTKHYEYQYDGNGNNILEIEYLPTGEKLGEKIFEYAPTEKRTVNLRLRELIYFGFWPWF